MAKRKPASSPTSIEALIRADVEGWTHAELVDFVVRKVLHDPQEFHRYQAASASRSSPGEAAAALRAGIDRALAVTDVNRRQLPAFMGQLEQLLAEIHALGQRQPSLAHELTQYFITALPRVFDVVDCEDELGLFGHDLVDACIRLAKRARLPVPAIAGPLLDAFLKDQHLVFLDIPGHLAGAGWGAKNRDALAQLLRAAMERADEFKRGTLKGALRGLPRRPARST